VFNHGDMYRDFTYIDDIIAGVVAASITRRRRRCGKGRRQRQA
jgi:nucleoside-diphosphate-sugar epimerase